MLARPPGATLDGRQSAQPEEATMWWGIGVGAALLYLVILFTAGMMTLRNGHRWMFAFGIFVPLLWLFGAIMRPSPAAL
jgi:hypothetical protein